ncbi:MAG: AbrB family transcriptional regulator, partial [Pseudomonadota bacterium]
MLPNASPNHGARTLSTPLRRQAATLLVATVGALCLISVPAGLLAGGMGAVAVWAVCGGPAHVDPRLRNTAFVALGVLLGSAASPETISSLPRWPWTLAALGICLALLMTVIPAYLSRVGGLDRMTAQLAAVPGALSYVLAVSETTGADVRRVTLLQSLRLSLLVFLVPFLVGPFAGGTAGEAAQTVTPAAQLPLLHAAALLAVCGLTGLAGHACRVPAPFLVVPMGTACVAYMTGIVEGQLPDWIAGPALVFAGAAIGSRFAGTDARYLLSSLRLGVMAMVLASVISFACAYPAAVWLELPLIQVWLAFAPGGLDTMTV